MENFSTCTLAKIFHWLDIRDLIRCSKVCKKWNELVYDSCLWKRVDLTDFSWTLDSSRLVGLINNWFKPCLRSLNLFGFSITPDILNQLAIDCPNLKALALESTIFVKFENLKYTPKFPNKLAYLDLRLSTGDGEAFRLMPSSLKRVEYLGFTDELLMHGNDTIEVRNLFEELTNVKFLDFNCCNSFYDFCLGFIGLFCPHITSLTIKHCNNIRGNSLHVLIQNCPLLKTLKFSGTSLHDENLENCDWDKVNLEELEISWCRNVTEYGLVTLLPKLQDLVYLRLCSCGFGQAITDEVLFCFDPSVHTKLKYLDFSFSREITNNGTAELIHKLPTLRQFNIACCPKLDPELLRKISTNKDLLVVANFREENPYAHHNDRCFSRIKKVGGDISLRSDLVDLDDSSFQSQFYKY